MKSRTVSLSIGAALLFAMQTTLQVLAQDFGDREARAGLTVGPSLVTGASITLESSDGFKLKPVFAWRGGAHGTYPLTDVISAGMEMGFDGRGTRTHHFNNRDLYFDTRVLYFSLYPNFTLSGFNIGFNFGFPMSASESSFDGRDVDISTEEVPVMLEGRIGAVIPLYDGEVGWVSMVIGAGFAFSELIEQPGQVDFFGDWRHVSAHLGARFEFLIPDTERE